MCLYICMSMNIPIPRSIMLCIYSHVWGENGSHMKTRLHRIEICWKRQETSDNEGLLEKICLVYCFSEAWQLCYIILSYMEHMKIFHMQTLQFYLKQCVGSFYVYKRY